MIKIFCDDYGQYTTVAANDYEIDIETTTRGEFDLVWTLINHKQEFIKTYLHDVSVLETSEGKFSIDEWLILVDKKFDFVYDIKSDLELFGFECEVVDFRTLLEVN